MQAIRVRFAGPDEGPVIYSILKSQHVTLADVADWAQDIGPYWLLVETDRPLGCIMVNPGRPVGRLEWLTVRPDVPKKQYAVACRDLCYAGFEVLAKGGSQFMACYIADHDQSWKQITERRGCMPVEHGTLMMKRL